MSEANSNLVFDRALVRAHRIRAANNFAAHSALFEESSELLIERLGDVKRDFLSALNLGNHGGQLAMRLAGRIPFIVAADVVEKKSVLAKQPAVVADEEFLPFAADSFDLIISNLNLHWANDLPGVLLQIRKTLAPGGLFLAALLGGRTLYELRACLLDAELKVTGGVSPRLSPTIELQTASALLQRAGFSLPVADQETVTLTYPDMFALMHDLRGMGESNAHLHRLRHPTRRSVFIEAAHLYHDRFALSDGGIPATLEVLFLHGWKG